MKVSYKLVASVWGWVFLIVGINFAFWPHEVTAFLTSLAGLAHLAGDFQTQSYSLWHILSLSLMAAVTVCAFWSARFPREEGVFAALITAKWVSTIGFSYLALTKFPAWWLCAFGDGTVAVTLMMARCCDAGVFAAMRAKWRSCGLFYEVHFGKINLAPDKVFWFRHTRRRGKTNEAALWAILFDGKTATHEKKIFNIEDEAALGVPLVAHGRSVGATNDFSWDVTLSPVGAGSVCAVPLAMRLLGLTRSVYHSLPILGASGKIKIGDSHVEFQNKPAMMGHISGKSQATAWSWLNANEFDDGADVVFEALSARLKICGKVVGPLSWFVLVINKKAYRFSSFCPTQKITTENDGNTVWRFSAACCGLSLRGEARFSDGVNPVKLDYEDTDGSPRVCLNSGLATLKLEVTDKTGPVHEYHASKKAMLEFVS